MQYERANKEACLAAERELEEAEQKNRERQEQEDCLLAQRLQADIQVMAKQSSLAGFVDD